jgi:hypothetical protein
MTIKLESIQEAKPALEALIQKDMSMAAAYKVSKLVKAINAELKTYDEMRIKLLQDIGSTLNETGDNYVIPVDKRQIFAEKMQELLAVEVEVPEKIDISGEDISISPDQLLALEPFLDFNFNE